MARRMGHLGTVAEDVAAILADRPKLKLRRSKATHDLPQWIIRAVAEIASAEGIARSDVVAWAIADLLRHYQAGEVDWSECKGPSRSPRTEWKLELPEECNELETMPA